MNYKDSKIIELAQRLGYTTAKEFASFLKIYKENISSDEKFISLALV